MRDNALNPLPPRLNLLGDRGRIVAMGVVLALLLFVFFWPAGKPPNVGRPAVNRPPAVDLEPFRPDPKILAQIRDSDAQERSALDHEPLRHLLQKSYNIGPAAAAALGSNRVEADVEMLSAHPEQHRGAFVWFKGRLEQFEEEHISAHPISRARAYRGRLRTASGAPVVFFVSKPLPPELDPAAKPWVRIEGFFMKIRDEYNLTAGNVLGAPLVIGPSLSKSHPDWDPVTVLDPDVLSRVAIARWDGPSSSDRVAGDPAGTGHWVSEQDMRIMLHDSQQVPLWHLASFAKYTDAQRAKAEARVRHEEIFETKQQYQKFKRGDVKQGSPWRVRGLFMGANVFEADPNPAGIQTWSEVWLQIPRLGAKLIPIWVASDIGAWKIGEGVDIDAWFFKNYAYMPQEGGERHAPLFVAATLERFAMKSHPATLYAGIGFALFIGLVGLLFFRMNVRAQRDSADYKERLVERRRNRRRTTTGTFTSVERHGNVGP
ncbi:MAG: hypothetical protein KDC87_13225 [Planctomycetes bacterium]|nr:hypothetical protein [Planctomycetota bacterium]MCB9872067.1 hypothetical protein [Planctomycetota bacterium]